MKKNIYFGIILIFSLLLNSCSDSEKTSEIEKDPIIGNWNTLKINNEFLNECEKMSVFSFLENGNIKCEERKIGNNDVCIKEYSTGNWKNLGNGKYDIFYEGIDELRGVTKITFTDNNNTMTFENKTQVYKRK